MTMLTEADFMEIVEDALDRPVPDFRMDANLYEEYGMDSMGAAVMVVDIQRLTGFRIPDEDIPTLRTCNAFLAYLEEKLIDA